MLSIPDELRNSPFIPVVTFSQRDNFTDLDHLVEILLKSGIKFLEIMFRNQNAVDTLQHLQLNSTNLIYGAGTVRTRTQFKQAIDSGVKFMVTPGISQDLCEFSKKLNFKEFYPGVDSTLGIEIAQAYGMSVLKFFPASIAGGVKWLKAIAGPYSDIQFIPTGGINIDNCSEYLSVPNVLAVGGSFLTPKELIQNKNWAEIETICTKALETYDNIKKNR